MACISNQMMPKKVGEWNGRRKEKKQIKKIERGREISSVVFLAEGRGRNGPKVPTFLYTCHLLRRKPSFLRSFLW